MPKIGANFQYESNQPNFERDQYATLVALKAVNVIDDGHVAFCQETGKHYEFHQNNTVDSTLGKWREWPQETESIPNSTIDNMISGANT